MKPTQKEIDYFTHPDQAWLQKLWEPAVGDWYAYPDFHETKAYYIKHELNPQREYAIWIPSLSDLLGMIVEEKATPVLTSYERLVIGKLMWVAHDDNAIDVSSDWQDTPTIASAELLRKVREEKR